MEQCWRVCPGDMDKGEPGGEGKRGDQLSNNPVPDSKLWIGLLQNLYQLQMVWIDEGLVLLFQSCRITRKQQDNQEEFQWGSNIDGIREARDHWLTAANICKWRYVGRGIYYRTHWHTTASTLRSFSMLCLFEGRLQVNGWYEGGREMSRTWVHGVKFIKD